MLLINFFRESHYVTIPLRYNSLIIIIFIVVVIKSLNHICLFVTPSTIACQALRSMGVPRQEYWSGLPFPPPRDLPNPGIELTSPALAGRFFTADTPRGVLLAVPE